MITAGFDLIDLDDVVADESHALAGSPDVFEGEEWTRAAFTAVHVVPVPAALPLSGTALGLLVLAGWRRAGRREAAAR